jgi:hypothetical protein
MLFSNDFRYLQSKSFIGLRFVCCDARCDAATLHTCSTHACEMSEMMMMMRMIFESFEKIVLIITVFREFKFEFSVKNKGNKFKASFLFKR